MKTSRFVAFLLVMLGLRASILQAAPEPPLVMEASRWLDSVTVAQVSSEFTGPDWDLAAAHMLDGSGLSGDPPLHDLLQAPGGNSWQTAAGVGRATVVFDLGAPLPVRSLHVWNLNFAWPYNGRGARLTEISTSPDSTSWAPALAATFPMASGAAGDPGFDVPTTILPAGRFLRLQINANFGTPDEAGCIGLSEIRFLSPLPQATPTRPVWTWSSGGGGSGVFRHGLDDPDLATPDGETTTTLFQPTENLTPGAHTLYVQERDNEGNWSASGSATIVVRIEVLAPIVTAGPLVLPASIHSVSSEFVASGWDLAANHLVDGSGLSGAPPVHAILAYPGGNSWQTGTQTGTGTVVFDLGSAASPGRLQVWNLNFAPPYNGRGAREVLLSSSTDAAVWSTGLPMSFPMASGAPDDPGFEVNLTGLEPGRYVRLEILDNFGTNDHAGHVGLSEVRFLADDPAATGDRPVWTWKSGGSGSGIFRYRLDDDDLTQLATETTATRFQPDTALEPGEHTLYVQEADADRNWSATGRASVVVAQTNPGRLWVIW